MQNLHTCTICSLCFGYLLFDAIERTGKFSLPHQEFDLEYVCFENYACICRLSYGLQLAKEFFGDEEVIANASQWTDISWTDIRTYW